jgi:hypothetical protein
MVKGLRSLMVQKVYPPELLSPELPLVLGDQLRCRYVSCERICSQLSAQIIDKETMGKAGRCGAKESTSRTYRR